MPTQLYNLEERCLVFARNVGAFVHTLPKSQVNNEYGKQLIRSAGSVGANYLEACEALGKKDFIYRLRIAKKEARESNYWLKLVQSQEIDSLKHQELLRESQELLFIISAIINKSGNKESSNQN